MKKVLMIVLALLISVAFVTTVFAQAKPAEKPAVAVEKAPAPEKPAKAEKPKAEKKEGAKAFKGEFVSADAAAKTIVAKGEKGDMTFDVSGIKKMAEFKAGDKIVVKYAEKDGKMVAKSVKADKPAKKAEKAEKKAEKAEAKPADKPAAAPAAPVAPAAPAKK